MSKQSEQAAPAVPVAPVEVAAKEVPRFTKEQILASKRYHARRDALWFLLSDEKTYSDAEIDSILKNYMKGAVK